MHAALNNPRRIRALTLTEVMVSIGVIAIFLASLHAMNNQISLLIRSSRNQAAASRVLQVRAEQLRNAGWSSITSPQALQHLVEQSPQEERTALFGENSKVTETVTVTELDPKTMAEQNANIVVRREAGVTTSSSSGRLSQADIVRVDFGIAWTESDRPVVPRRVSVTISRGGMVRGSIASAPETDNSTPPISPTP
ncbi:unnamed protein product [uncultured bacterium]|nr:unnamed protein product [uncultured bacterium]